MNCPHCHADTSARSKFCTQCGTRVAQRCESCQADNAIASKFCTQCGDRLAQIDEPTAREQNAGDRRVVTVLFTDVSGFTAMSEKLTPEEVTEIVNDFFAVLTEPIYRFGGVVDKYIGDAIMALFGAPVAHEDDPERAVHAAYEMQQRAAEFANSLEARTGITLRVRIGIHTGLVVAGAVGGEQKRDYTVMGETVHLAQRMESAAKPGKVLVTQATYKLAARAFEFLPMPPVTLAGRSQPIDAWEVVAPRSATSDAVRERAAFIGRHAELGVLEAAAHRALGGSPEWVVVTGEAGIGKSHLVAHFVQTRLKPPPKTLRARCQSYTSATSFGMLASMLSYWLDLPSSAPSETLRQRLQARCQEAGVPDADRLADLLVLFLGLDSQNPENASLSQEQRRNASIHALHRLLIKLASQGPLLLSLEDLQWADDASLGWFSSFLDAVSSTEGDLPLFIVCQQRPEARPLPTDHWKRDYAALRLRAFDSADSRAIAAATLKTPLDRLEAEPTMDQLLDQVVDRADGNPFYLHELLNSLIDSGVLRKDDSGSWQAILEGQTLKLPSTIQGAVASRLDRLDRNPKGLLQLGSVLGRTFALPTLEAVARRESDQDHTLQDLSRQGFLYQNSQGDFAFTQPLIQEVAYESLLLSSRKELHGRVGKAFERLYQGHLEEHAQLLAYHFVLADQKPPALKYLFLAAKRTLGLYDLSRARQDLESALSIARELGAAAQPAAWEVNALLGEVLTLSSQYEEAFEALDAALKEVPTPVARALVLRTKGDAHERKGEFQAALECFESGMGCLPGEAPFDRAPFLSKMGYARYRLGQSDECVRLCTEAIALLDGSGRLKDLAFAHSYLGICHWRRGDFEPALQHTEEALRHREAAKDLGGVAASYANLANIAADRGKWQEADTYYRRSLEAYERIGDPYFVSLVRNNLGSHLMQQGELDEAESQFQAALTLKRQIGDKQGVGIALFNVGDVQFRRGKASEALKTMQEALAIFLELDSREFYPEVYMTMARVCVEMDARDLAWEYVERSRTFAEEVEDDATQAILPRIESQLLLLAGERERAEERAREAVRLLEAQENPLDLGRAHAQLAEVLKAAAESRGYRSAVEAARDLFVELGARLDLDQLEAVHGVRVDA